MAKTPKDSQTGYKGPSDASGKIVSMSKKMEAIRELLLRPDREKVAVLDERLSTLEEHASDDVEFSDRLAKQFQAAFEKMDANGKKVLAKHLAGILEEDVKIQIKSAGLQIRQALLPSFGAFIGQGILFECRKVAAYIVGLFQAVKVGRHKAIENRKTNSLTLASHTETDVRRTKHLWCWGKSLWFFGTAVAVISLLILGGSTAINHVWQASLINRAQTAVSEQPELAAYPFSFSMKPGNGIMRVTGLLNDASQLVLLEKTLRQELPNMRFDKNVRTFFDDAVVPKLDRFVFSVEANSQNIEFLGQELDAQRKFLREIEQAFVRTDRMIDVLRAMKPEAPNFYMSKPLAILRTDIEASMLAPESAWFNGRQSLYSDNIEQLVGGLTVAFSENAEIIDLERAVRVGQVLEAVLRGDNRKRQVNVVAVVKTGDDESPSLASKRGQIMLRQIMRILLENNMERDNLSVSVMFEDPMSPRSELLEGISEDSWLHNSFVGLSFAN